MCLSMICVASLDGLGGVDVSITAQQGGLVAACRFTLRFSTHDLDIAANATEQIIL